ncbi:hypothetical protein ATANTOWER_018124 [Ataeniobius toweri]|uniref:Uncharacterized protein n=1 Tax=Ataeniobius toweri TaxID=208326 RepID=A0ABU7BMZ3_9TELE|nr:hypothetical protein [Ataeniobius toweri]
MVFFQPADWQCTGISLYAPNSRREHFAPELLWNSWTETKRNFICSGCKLDVLSLEVYRKWSGLPFKVHQFVVLA